MRKLFRYLYFSVAFFFLFMVPVQAYIDPSVMTYAIQAVAGVAIALGTVFGLYWRKLLKVLRTVFRVRSNKHAENESDEISFTDPETKKVTRPEDIKEKEVKESIGKYLSVNRDNKKQEISEDKMSFGKKAATIGLDLLPGLLIVCAITYMLCYYAPLEIYMNNKNEFWFDYSVLQPQLLELCWTFLKIGFLIVIACYAIHRKLYNGALFAGISSLAILYIQGNYFASNLPAMDGTEIEWANYMPEMEQSAILCLSVIIIVAILFRVLKDKKFSYVVDFTCILITAMLVVSLADINKNTNGTQVKQNDFVVSKNNQYDYSSDKNFIVFVVDAFDSQTFNNIVSNSDEYKAMFDGFTYYPDTVCAYPFTSRAIPFILSGKWYENEGEYKDFEAEAISDSPLLNSLEQQGYRLDAYEDEFLFDTNMSRYSNVVKIPTKLSSKYKLREEELNLALFKYFPFFMKGNNEVNLDSFSDLKETEDPDVDFFKMSDSDYYNDLLNSEITTTDQKVFKFIHIEGAHVPFNYDEDMNPIADGTYEQKQRATLTILKQYIQKLKDSGVYDNSTIMIMGDHGYNYDDLEGRQNALLMVKSENEHHELQWSDLPISYDDLQGSYQNLLNGLDSEQAFDGLTEDNQARRYLLFSYTKENVITEYYQMGYATDLETMQPSGKIYKYKGKHLKENLEGQE